MDQFRKVLATIQKDLKGLTPTQKLLIGSLAVIALMTLFLVSQYAGRPQYAAVWPAGTPEDQQRILATLSNAGFPVASDARGFATVPTTQLLDAQSALAQAGQQPANSQLVFDNIATAQSWINSKEHNRQIYKVMRDNWLSSVIGNFRGVQSAKVYVDAPEQIGFGAAARPAKASVTIFSTPGTPLSQETIDAAAKMVAGSVAGLDLERVSVIDGTTGRPCKVRTDDALSSATNREHARAIEREFEAKISDLLSHIHGAMVAVTATVDTSRIRTQTTKNLPAGEGTVLLPRRESSTSQVDAQSAQAAEPGVRSNATADINAIGVGRGTRSEHRQEETEYTAAIGVERKEIEDPRGVPTRLVATVTVPRRFVVDLIQRDQALQAGGNDPGPPTREEIDNRFAMERDSIKSAIEPHLKTQLDDGTQVQGEVVVILASGDGPAGIGGGGGGSPVNGWVGTMGRFWAMEGGAMDKIVLGVLALVAMGMMFLLIRKAGRRVDMPTAEELVGLPPALEAKNDIVGEADETETAMAGIEVGEEEIKAAKMRESVSEFIRQSPESASKLLNRWIAVEQ